MARYKPYDLKQITLVSVSFQDQILLGSFEYALNEIVDQHIDMTPFDARYKNDETGCLAYDPAILLKIVLFGYYKGIISSRRLAEACERNIQFKALTADTQPHFTTIADFVSSLNKEIVGVFRDVLVYADELGLIGKQTFAIDGCKLPSNASKEWSGTHEELVHRQKKYESAAKEIVERHRSRDAKEKLSPMQEQDDQKLATFKKSKVSNRLLAARSILVFPLQHNGSSLLYPKASSLNPKQSHLRTHSP